MELTKPELFDTLENMYLAHTNIISQELDIKLRYQVVARLKRESTPDALYPDILTEFVVDRFGHYPYTLEDVQSCIGWLYELMYRRLT